MATTITTLLSTVDLVYILDSLLWRDDLVNLSTNKQGALPAHPREQETLPQMAESDASL